VISVPMTGRVRWLVYKILSDVKEYTR
jgi:hypothetical protein